MEFNAVSEELKDFLEHAEEKLDWMSSLWIQEDGRTYAEMETYSPEGENFGMVIDFDKDNQAETFLADLRDYAENFDVDEHVELWLPSRGKNGCPSSLKELLEDAEAIQEMVEELADELQAFLEKRTEDADTEEEPEDPEEESSPSGKRWEESETDPWCHCLYLGDSFQPYAFIHVAAEDGKEIYAFTARLEHVAYYAELLQADTLEGAKAELEKILEEELSESLEARERDAAHFEDLLRCLKN